MKEEVPKVLFLRTWKDECGLGIEFFGSDHGCEGVEIRIDVGGNDLFRCISRILSYLVFFVLPLRHSHKSYHTGKTGAGQLPVAHCRKDQLNKW